MGRIRFGPLGRMMLIDTPRDGFNDEAEEIGGSHESLNGTRTKDVFGYRATYKIDLEGLDARALSWFEMAHRGALGSPLYFVDEQRVNKLSARASSTLSAYADYDPFTHPNGTHVKVPNTSLLLPGTLDGSPVQTPGPTSAVSWTNTATQNLIKPNTMIPVQAGEHIVLSVYVLSTTGGTPLLEFTPYANDGTQLGQNPPSAGMVVTPGPPARYWIPYVIPAGTAAVVPCIRHVVAQTTVFTAMQLETGDTPTPWVMGGANPTVLVDEIPTKRRYLGNYKDLSVTLLEA